LKPVYFISDIHLGAPSLKSDFENRRRIELVKFFDQVEKNGSRMVIVGDLFDFWYEYKYVVPKNFFWLYARLGEMVHHGIAVDYVAGNHDFYLGKFFSESIGLRIYQDGFSEEIGGKKFLVIHGDGLALRDSGYRMLKRILRNGFVQSAIRWVHPDIGFSMARAFSKKSREYTTSKDFGETDGMLLFAGKKIEEGYDVVVMGHNHVPKFERFGNGLYINLGDWLGNFTYGVFDGNEMQLVKWEFGK
jgi:UDP-2,3-diacylglucosamine hydrolase